MSARRTASRWRLSLRAQLAAAAAVLVLVIVALAGTLIAVRIDQRDRAEVDKQLAARAERLGDDVSKLSGDEAREPKAESPDDTFGNLLDGSESLVRLIAGGVVVAQRGAVPAEPIPESSADGYSTVTIDGEPWRSYVARANTSASGGPRGSRSCSPSHPSRSDWSRTSVSSPR